MTPDHPPGQTAPATLDPFERDVLPVLRHFLATHRHPATQSWEHGFAIAVNRWGEPRGLALAYDLSHLARAAHAATQGRLRAGDPLCLDARARLTEDEIYLLHMLHHMRRDATPAARLALSALTRGRMDRELIRAGLSFAARYPAAPRQTALQPARERAKTGTSGPRLSLVT